jgi:hypothetical protein
VCGACGSGSGLPRWEDRLEPATRRALAARASWANRLLGQSRLRVKVWGNGYLLADGRGRSTPAGDLDELWRACGRSGFALLPEPCGRGPLGEADEEVVLDPSPVADLALLATWAGATAHTFPLAGSLRLRLSDPPNRRLMELELRRSVVHVEVLPVASVPPSMSGPDARAAAAFLSAALVSGAGLTKPAAPVG